MTCTHAAIKRGEFLRLNLQYDNLIMEEAAQILDIETFIPMMLQNPDKEFGNRLKRIVLIGDHMQLPPVIKNRSFQKYSHMDQSLFTRFVRLGMPFIQLNAQGRMRPALANLWNWRYQSLGNLPALTTEPRFQMANAGFAHEYQLINVDDAQGAEESAPTAHFIQNLQEAEYVVQVYMYMRLLGYPRHKISIITTYNGQKALLRDIVQARCSGNPLFGEPAKVTTVDKFQGQQNDYVLLSLVRTKTAGHIRDIRRLVVAMSRARLGLYIFGKASLFANCYELARSFHVLLQKPTELMLMQNERSLDGSSSRKTTDSIASAFSVRDVAHLGQIVAGMTSIAQHEYETNQAHWRQQEEEELARLAVLEARAEAARQAKESVRREEAKAQANLEKDKIRSEMQDAMDKELALNADSAGNIDPSTMCLCLFLICFFFFCYSSALSFVFVCFVRRRCA